ncbi:MAG: DUF401 family protein [Tissierellaceae bacterium]|nr:DUF401 family protein [Tissierellaceae bacterium]
MDLIKLLIVFIIIIILIKMRKPLYLSILVGAVVASILYNIGFSSTLKISFHSMTDRTTITILLSFYVITFLQRMLEKRGDLDLAQRSLNGLFNSRRVNASLAPFFIGLLPSPGAVVIAGPMVDTACGDFFSKEDKAFITSYYRHIPESFLPTYSSIILASQLTDVHMSMFILGMIPIVILLFVLGDIFYLKRLPKETGYEGSGNKKTDLLNLFKSLWTITFTIVLILIFDLQVFTATLITIFLSVIINKFRSTELKPMFISAYDNRIMSSTVAVMIFKDIITDTGVINELPTLFNKLPIPTSIAFALIFLIGSIVSGANAIIALGVPMAFAAISNGGTPLLILLMSFAYAGMQISPTHVCLTIVTEYFDTSMVDLIKKTIPIITIFCILTIGYYLLLNRLIV